MNLYFVSGYQVTRPLSCPRTWHCADSLRSCSTATRPTTLRDHRTWSVDAGSLDSHLFFLNTVSLIAIFGHFFCSSLCQPQKSHCLYYPVSFLSHLSVEFVNESLTFLVALALAHVRVSAMNILKHREPIGGNENLPYYYLYVCLCNVSSSSYPSFSVVGKRERARASVWWERRRRKNINNTTRNGWEEGSSERERKK